MLWVPILGAIALSAVTILEKVALKKKKLNVRLFQTSLFLVVVLVMIPFLFFFWKLDPGALTTKNIIISGLLVEESYNIISETSCNLKLMNAPVNHSVIISTTINNNGYLKFLTIGDTQGFTEIFSDMLEHPLVSGNEFVLHLVDISPSGSRSSLEVFNRLSVESSIPIYPTPGNHDIKENNNTENFE